jgi:hypothetical protein
MLAQRDRGVRRQPGLSGRAVDDKHHGLSSRGDEVNGFTNRIQVVRGRPDRHNNQVCRRDGKGDNPIGRRRRVDNKDVVSGFR